MKREEKPFSVVVAVLLRTFCCSRIKATPRLEPPAAFHKICQHVTENRYNIMQKKAKKALQSPNFQGQKNSKQAAKSRTPKPLFVSLPPLPPSLASARATTQGRHDRARLRPLHPVSRKSVAVLRAAMRTAPVVARVTAAAVREKECCARGRRARQRAIQMAAAGGEKPGRKLMVGVMGYA